MKPAMPLLLLALAACAGRIDAPSLLPRAVEANRPEDVTPPPAPVADPADAAIAARMLEQARAADAAFLAALPASVPQGPVGSEAWVAAQTKLSAAEVARGPAVDALRALDGAIAQATDAGRDPAALVEARRAVEALVARQSERLDALTR